MIRRKNQCSPLRTVLTGLLPPRSSAVFSSLAGGLKVQSRPKFHSWLPASVSAFSFCTIWIGADWSSSIEILILTPWDELLFSRISTIELPTMVIWLVSSTLTSNSRMKVAATASGARTSEFLYSCSSRRSRAIYVFCSVITGLLRPLSR